MEPPSQRTVFSDPLIGAILGGKYQVEYRIARGGSGAVYRAIQHPIQRPVAVKVMRPDLTEREQEAFEERFLKEASQLGNLQHPNIVTVHDFGRTEDGACFIVMELLEGETFKQALRHGPMSLEQGIDVCLQLTRGLRHAHRAGMIHRDIKAGNAMLIPDGEGRFRAKLLDFGLVKISDESSITDSGVFMGTPHYVSPEQARGKTADHRSDLYSMGVLMYRIFTGRLPYYNRNSMAIALAHIQQPFPLMSHRAPDIDVPAAVEAVVRRCMEKDAACRYPDADALLGALNQLRQQLTPALASVETVSLPVADVSRWRHPVLLVVFAGLLVTGSLLGAVLWVNASSPASPPSPAVVVPAPVEPEPSPLRELAVMISSEPSGATVFLEELDIGTTPFAGKINLEPDEPTKQSLRLELTGHHPDTSVLDLSRESTSAHVVLQPIPRPRRPTKKKATPPAGPSVAADGISFTAAEAAAAVRFVNQATEDELRQAGISGRQLSIISDKRPFASIEAFAETHYIGEKTVAAAKRAAL